MRKALLGLGLLVGGFGSSPAFAVSPFDCPAIPGMVMGQQAAACYFMGVNSDGSINTTVTGSVLPTGAATAANQTAVQAAPGSDAASAIAVQGITGGKAVTVSGATVDGTAISGNPVRVGGVYNTTAPSYTAGQQTTLQTNGAGNLINAPSMNSTSGSDGVSNTANVALGTTLSGVSGTIFTTVRQSLYNGTSWDRPRTIQGFNTTGTGIFGVETNGSSFLNLTANGTSNAIKSGAGILHKVCINTKGASANTLTLYDALTATGTKIGTFDNGLYAF